MEGKAMKKGRWKRCASLAPYAIRLIIFLTLIFAVFHGARISLALLFDSSEDYAALTTILLLGILFSTARLLSRMLFQREVDLIAAALMLRVRTVLLKIIKPLFTSAFSSLHSHRYALALILFLLAFHGTTNYVVMRQDTVFFDGIPAHHYVDTAKLSTGGFRKLLSTPWRFLTWYSVPTQYPIVSPAGSALFLSVFGVTQDNAVLSNLVWLAILLPSLYALALKLFNRRCALLSMLFVAFFPGIVAASRGFIKDLPLTAMVSLSLALLLYSEGMKKRLPSIIFGFAVALTALTHGLFIFSLPGPFLLEVVIPLFKNCKSRTLAAIKLPLTNCAIAAIIVLFLAGPWYALYAMPFVKEVVYAAEGRAGSYSLQMSFPLLVSTLRNHLSLGLFILAVSGFIILRDTKKKNFLLGWATPSMMAGWAPALFQTRYIPRYLIPAIPAFAIILGRLLEAVLGHVGGKAKLSNRLFLSSCSVLLCLGMLFTLHTTFREYRTLLGPLDKGGTFDPWELGMGYRISPVRMGADIESAVDFLTEGIEMRNSQTELFITNPLGSFTQMITTELKVRQIVAGKQEFLLKRCLNDRRLIFKWTDAEECIKLITSADYLIIEDMNSIPVPIALNETFPTIIDYIQENFDSFEMAIIMPKGDISPRIGYNDPWYNPDGSMRLDGMPLEDLELKDITPDFIKGRVLILKAPREKDNKDR